MKTIGKFGLLIVMLVALPTLYATGMTEKHDQPADLSVIATRGVNPSEPGADGLSPADMGLRSERINAVIYPYQSATVSTEVRGIVDCINFKEGETARSGAVVAEISKARYQAIVGEFKGNFDAVVATLARARDEVAIQEELYERRSTTYDDLNKARAQVKVLEARREEAEHKLVQAELNLKACIVKAPFTGSVSVLYHEPFEAVDNLEKLFGLVEISRVYARANWPEARLSEVSIGKKALFHYDGQTYEGVVEKISSLIDPASKSKRIHVLVENPAGKLQVGMSGMLAVVDGK